jgi:uncharacterized linocin/CFP29 family protein
MDFIYNGLAEGGVASKLMAADFDANALRPYIGKDNRSYITRNNQALVTNAPATLRKDEWIQLDTAVLKTAKARLNAVADLRSAGLQYSIPNGLGKTTLEHEAQGDISGAEVSMDGLRESESARPHYDLKSLPLPIIHKDFSFSARQVAASRNGGSPLDTTTAELAARRVAEQAEAMLLGTASTYSYGGGNIYGYTNFPDRITKSLTAPTSANHATTVAEVLDMMKQLQDANYYGPYTLYYSPAWTVAMNEDFVTAKGDNTLKQRLEAIDNIKMCKQADYLTGTTLILKQDTADVARMVVGLDVTTVQWESHGGMQLNFKVMTILVPQLRSDFYGNCGIAHGSV